MHPSFRRCEAHGAEVWRDFSLGFEGIENIAEPFAKLYRDGLNKVAIAIAISARKKAINKLVHRVTASNLITHFASQKYFDVKCQPRPIIFVRIPAGGSRGVVAILFSKCAAARVKNEVAFDHKSEKSQVLQDDFDEGTLSKTRKTREKLIKKSGPLERNATFFEGSRIIF